MRARAIVAVLGACAIAAAAPGAAGAASHLKRVGFRARGSVRVVWHGDRAHGCAAAGMCGYSGSIVYPAFGHAFIEVENEGGSQIGYFGLLESRGRTRIRTERTLPGGGTTVCSQRSHSTAFTLGADRAWRGRQWFSIGTAIFPQPLGSGQCAGPRIQDFEDTLPSSIIRERRIERRGTRVSLRGRFPFRSGPLAGQVISTLRLRSLGVHRERLFDGYAEEPHHLRRHELAVELRYKVVRMQGEVREDFRAVDAPICLVRDACGSHGSAVYSVDSAGRTLGVMGFARTDSARHPSLRHALRTIFRRGQIYAFVSTGHKEGLTSHAWVPAHGPSCIDRFRPRSPPFLGVIGNKHAVSMQLFENEYDVLRGRCPGPAPSLAGSLARARVKRGQLLTHALTVRLRATRHLRSGAYRGTREGRVNVRLRRTRARVRVDGRRGSRTATLRRDGIRP